MTLYIDNVGASISYMKGRVGTTDGDSVRYVNSPNAVVGAYHMYTALENAHITQVREQGDS